MYRPVHERLALMALASIFGGAGFLFGWMLVKEGGGGRSGASPYRLLAPGWLPVAGAVCIVVGVVTMLLVQLTAPLSTGERLPEHLRRPVDDRIWPKLLATMAPFIGALIVTTAAATESGDRFEPLAVAAVFALFGTPMLVWIARSQSR